MAKYVAGAKNIGKVFNKKILIAVDESQNARRAVSYVGQLLGGLMEFEVTILHVIPEPEEDYFPTTQEKVNWLNKCKQKANSFLSEYRQILVNMGFSPENVTVRSTLRYCPSMAQCILVEKDQNQYSTIVVGRHGISRSEEFLFGSVSSRIVTHAKGCTVWVVE